MIVAGVDGCPGGWIAAVLDTETRVLGFRGFPTFAHLFIGLGQMDAIGIDIPIGLTYGPGRRADSLARQHLPGKASSVFNAPHPAIRHERVFACANELSTAMTGKGISQQALAIFPKIAEVNDLLAPGDQDRVIEVHPEVSFAALNGSPVRLRKATPEGYAARHTLLQERACFREVPYRTDALAVAPGTRVNADDVLDAIVAAWTAERFVRGESVALPEETEIGFRGLKAQIVY